MAEALRFIKPGALTVEYRRSREGPNSYLVWEPHRSYICLNSAAVVKATKWSKSTQTGVSLRAWLKTMDALDQISTTDLSS